MRSLRGAPSPAAAAPAAHPALPRRTSHADLKVEEESDESMVEAHAAEKATSDEPSSPDLAQRLAPAPAHEGGSVEGGALVVDDDVQSGPVDVSSPTDDVAASSVAPGTSADLTSGEGLPEDGAAAGVQVDEEPSSIPASKPTNAMSDAAAPASPAPSKLEEQFESLTLEFYTASPAAAAASAAERELVEIRTVAAKASKDAQSAAAEAAAAAKELEHVVATADVGGATRRAERKSVEAEGAAEALAVAVEAAAGAKELVKQEKDVSDRAAEKEARAREDEAAQMLRKQRADEVVEEARARLETAQTASVTDVKAREERMNVITAEIAELMAASGQVGGDLEAVQRRTAEAAAAAEAARAVVAEAEAKAEPLLATELTATQAHEAAGAAAAQAWEEVEAKRQEVLAAEGRAAHAAAVAERADVVAQRAAERMAHAEVTSVDLNESAWARARAQARGEIAMQTAKRDTCRRLAEHRAAELKRVRREEAIVAQRGANEFHLPIKAALVASSPRRLGGGSSSGPTSPKRGSTQRPSSPSRARVPGLTTDDKVVLHGRSTSRSPDRRDGSAPANIYPLAAQLIRPQ